MKTVTRKTFDRNVKEGHWEAITDINSFGRVEVRNVHSNKRFLVTISDAKTFRVSNEDGDTYTFQSSSLEEARRTTAVVNEGQRFTVYEETK